MIYVLSDVHGNLRRFESIMEQINLQREDTLYVLGDVIDRFPDGIRILRQIMSMPNAKMLLGNHEYMMMETIRALENPDPGEIGDPRILRVWYNNGGGITHSKLKHLNKTLRAEIFDYVDNLPLSYDVEVNGVSYRLVHAAPVELFQNYRGKYDDEKECAVWQRIRPNEDLLTNQVVIFGHTPTIEFQNDIVLRIWYGKKRICIDCGCSFTEEVERSIYAKGRLACLRLDDMKEFYSEENIPDEGPYFP